MKFLAPGRNGHIVLKAIILHLIFSSFDGIFGTKAHYRLLRDLMDDYNAMVRPVRNASHVTQVTMKFFVSQIIDMDERIQTLKINTWLTFNWTDEYLTWETDAYQGITNVKLPSHLMWLPDIVLYENAADEYINFMKDRIAVVYSDGYVMWAAPVILQSQCQIDVTYFPFDEQDCKLKFGPWQHDGTEVAISGKGDVTVFKSDGEWDMESMTSESNVEHYPDAPGIPYTDVTYVIHLRRRPIFYFFNLITPCVLLAAVTMLTFFLPAEAGEKITLGITVLLSLTVFLLLLAEAMPPSSEVPLIGQYYAMTMAMVTLSLAMSVTVLHLHYNGGEMYPVPGWMRKFILHYIAGVLRMKLEKISPTPRRQPNRTPCKCAIEDTMKSLDIMHSNGNALKRNNTTQEGASGTRGQNSHDIHAIFHLLAEFRKVSGFYEQKSREKYVKKEWKQVAMVMDRLFLILYVFGTLLTILIIIFQIQL
ncbi:neuronal acetylcholine receptor subunit alpha-10-like [Ptychodera flava]|uniref:neuronal acetylcholine receptor subunit alpha-10-like n=1 Tax=Ptychodera flava TaxID=63121 RepID=UPI00396A2865